MDSDILMLLLILIQKMIVARLIVTRVTATALGLARFILVVRKVRAQLVMNVTMQIQRVTMLLVIRRILQVATLVQGLAKYVMVQEYAVMLL